MPGDDVDLNPVDAQNTAVQDAITDLGDTAQGLVDDLTDAPLWAKTMLTRIDGVGATIGTVASLATRQAAREQAIEEAARERASEAARAKANEEALQAQTGEQIAAIKDAITPPDEEAPNAGEKPQNLQELPEKENRQERGKDFWFGKSARRHEDSKSRFGL